MDDKGSFFQYHFDVLDENGRLIAQISKKRFTWADTFEIVIINTEDKIAVLAIVLTIQTDIQQARTAAVTSAN